MISGIKILQPQLAREATDRPAKLLAADMKEHGGLITLDDLTKYAAIERKPLTGTYRGHTIVTAPPPSSGGVGVLQMLGVLEGTGFEKAQPYAKFMKEPSIVSSSDIPAANKIGRHRIA